MDDTQYTWMVTTWDEGRVRKVSCKEASAGEMIPVINRTIAMVGGMIQVMGDI